ncbi:Acyl carrier protein 2, mitochondrial [Vitis vinifera]|uniref:Acyl carrier protein n=1 Tax=Vitis vinifera TaxID=29760 RepID=A0A438CS45_VITVI|nr:Acyl carrier protein 2, mitochondrial [Vitis vinifera]
MFDSSKARRKEEDVKENDFLMVTPTANFQTDLGLDSLDAVEVVMALEEEFGFEIPDNEADKINTINVAVDFISSHPQAK